MKKMKQVIHNSESSDYDIETIEVTAISGERQVTFHVQTTNGEYRADLGCLISDYDGEINEDDYKDFDLNEITEEANSYAKTLEEETRYKIDNDSVFILERAHHHYELGVENVNYINAFASYYQRRLFRVGDQNGGDEPMKFATREDAIEWLEKNAD